MAQWTNTNTYVRMQTYTDVIIREKHSVRNPNLTAYGACLPEYGPRWAKVGDSVYLNVHSNKPVPKLTIIILHRHVLLEIAYPF